MKLLLLAFLLFLSACGDSNDSSGDSEELESVAGSDAAALNPIVTTQFFGRDGNLYKPAGDDHGGNPGNLVVLLSSQFTEQFDSCEIPLNDGTVAQLICINNQPWTQTPFSCFTNGNRQTWRANFKCSKVGDVRVTCRDFNQEVIFTVPDAARNQVCNRF